MCIQNLGQCFCFYVFLKNDSVAFASISTLGEFFRKTIQRWLIEGVVRCHSSHIGYWHFHVHIPWSESPEQLHASWHSIDIYAFPTVVIKNVGVGKTHWMVCAHIDIKAIHPVFENPL